MRVILASNSPRRKELLGQIFDDFDVMPQNVQEKCDKVRPGSIVMTLARQKLGDLPKLYKDCVIIASDTIVYRNKKIYGKPKSQAHAKEILCELSDKWHSVYTGICVFYADKTYTAYDKSLVKFKLLDDSIIEEYIATGSPMDKAGAYGIQDKQVVEKYKGSYTNIVGLPMEKLKELLKNIEII